MGEFLAANWPGIAIAVFFTALYLLAKLAQRDIDQTWVVVLYRLMVGPRTDVAHMTRSELFRSAASFVTWTLLSGTGAMLMMLMFPEHQFRATLPMIVVAICCFFMLMGLGAAVYLLIRGLFRSRAYQPPPGGPEPLDEFLARRREHEESK